MSPCIRHAVIPPVIPNIPWTIWCYVTPAPAKGPVSSFLSIAAFINLPVSKINMRTAKEYAPVPKITLIKRLLIVVRLLSSILPDDENCPIRSEDITAFHALKIKLNMAEVMKESKHEFVDVYHKQECSTE